MRWPAERADLERPAVAGGVELEVERPDDVRGDGDHGSDRHADAGQALATLSIGDLQALFAPEPVDALPSDAPPRAQPVNDQVAAVQRAIREGTYGILMAASEVKP